MTQHPADRTPGRPHPPHPVSAAAHFRTAAAWDLLARTAELPRSKRGLMAVLREYRTTLHALAAHADHAEQALLRTSYAHTPHNDR